MASQKVCGENAYRSYYRNQVVVLLTQQVEQVKADCLSHVERLVQQQGADDCTLE